MAEQSFNSFRVVSSDNGVEVGPLDEDVLDGLEEEPNQSESPPNRYDLLAHAQWVFNICGEQFQYRVCPLGESFPDERIGGMKEERTRVLGILDKMEKHYLRCGCGRDAEIVREAIDKVSRSTLSWVDKEIG